MKIICNGATITLPDLKGISTAGTGSTSAIETSFLSEFKARLTKDNQINNEERMRAYCLNELHKIIQGDYQSYFEPLGGVGVTASIFSEDPLQTHLNELDDSCLNVIRQNFPTWTLYQQDMFKFEYPQNFDTIFLDFNNYTVQKYGTVYYDVVQAAAKHCNQYLIINDCSVFYLNRGAKSFETYSKILGETVTNYDDFYPVLKEFYEEELPGWTLVRVEKFYASSYLLLVRKDLVVETVLNNPPIVRTHTSEDMKAAPVLWLEMPPKTKKLI